MYIATSVARWIARLTGVTQIVLGVLIWLGQAYALLPLHMLVGAIFVLNLWALAGLAGRAGVGARWVLLAIGWGIFVPAFGMAHPGILPGPYHWIVRVIHLLIGLAAMGIADRLAAYVLRRRDLARPAVHDARHVA